MTRSIDRRRFLTRAAAVSGAALAAPALLRTVLADAATVIGAGPYGALATVADANGFLLPAGFSSRLLAVSGSTVAGTQYSWHYAPDGGVCFPAPGGGWVYVSNSELPGGAGGASALRFDGTGRVVDAYRILSGTTANCAGGPTASGTWLSCEEVAGAGRVHECDPLGPGQGVVRPALGVFAHEAAIEDPQTGVVYLTEDDPAGRLYRFVPTTRGDLSAGQLYAASVTGGVITWVPTGATSADRQSTTTAFRGGEGIYIDGRRLYFTTKGDKRVWLVLLDTMAISVLYDGVATPGAALNAVDNLTVHGPSGDVFVCEDGGNMEVCVLTPRPTGDVEVAAFLRIVGHDSSEWTGVAFSPDQTRMYLSSQRGTDGLTGRTYEITGPFRTATAPPTTTTSSTSTTSSTTTTTTAAAVTTTLAIGTDAHVRDGAYAGTNYGNAGSASVQTAAVGRNQWFFVKADTSAHTRGVTSARLRIKASAGAGTTALALRAVSTGWSETGLTWNTKPTPGAVVANASVRGTTPTWVTFDVTAYVRSERAAGRSVVGFVVLATKAPSALVTIATGEAPVVANRPQLVIVG